MNMSEEIFCYHCKKTFYLNSFRLREAKTVSCLYCEKRIDKNKSIIEEAEHLQKKAILEDSASDMCQEVIGDAENKVLEEIKKNK